MQTAAQPMISSSANSGQPEGKPMITVQDPQGTQPGQPQSMITVQAPQVIQPGQPQSTIAGQQYMYQQPTVQYTSQPPVQYVQQPGAPYVQQPGAPYVQQPGAPYVQQPMTYPVQYIPQQQQGYPVQYVAPSTVPMQYSPHPSPVPQHKEDGKTPPPPTYDEQLAPSYQPPTKQ